MSTVRKSPLASAPKANAATLPDMLREPLLPVPNRPRSFEEIFDALMVAARGGKAHRVIEDHLRPVFEATHAVLWVSLDSERALYSPTHQLHAPLKANLVATGFRSCAAFHVPAMKAHPLFSVDVDARLIPPQQPLLMIPIYTKDNQGLGVLQFSRKEYKVFVSHEFTMANFLINKFKVFGRLLFFNQTAITAAIGASQFGSSNAIIESLRRTILRTFRCRRAELWIYDSARNRTLRYDGSEQDPFFCDLGKAGLAGYAIKHSMLINERSAQDHFAKNDRFDGLNDEPVLIYPYNETDELKWAISARGKIAPPFFSIGDEALMKAIAPFLVRSISESQTSGATAAIIQTYQNSLYALLDTAELLAGILDFDDLVCTIGAKTCELLNAHHFTLYLVSLDGDRLVSHPTDPNEAPVSVLVSSPIIGESACQGAIVNIADAQCDHRFDKSEDARRGRRTTALLSAPIRNGKGAVTGVALLTNRCDGGAFDVDAVKLLLSLTVLYGIALENARLSQAAAGLARRVPAFASQCASLGAKAAVRSALESALANAREIAGAAKVALWLCHGGDEIVQLLAVGHSAAATLPSVKAAVRARTFVVTDSQNRPAPSLQDGRVGRPADTRQEDLIGMNELDSMAYLRASRVMRVAAQKRDDVGAEEDSVCCVPLVNADGLVTGVLDVAGPRRIAQEEIRLLGAVAAFAAVVVEKGAHEALRNFTDQESDLQEYISMPERPRTDTIPTLLAFTVGQQSQIFTADFDSSVWDRIGHLKILFAIFHAFRLQEACHIDNEKLYRCFTALREAHNQVRCHDWKHAVDAAQFVAFQIKTSAMDNIFTALELCAVTMAALCRDANHAGLANPANERAELPLGILFSRQSVREARQCAAAISAVSRPPCNIFYALEPADFAFIWTTIIALVMATDISKHFERMKTMNERLDGGYDTAIPEDRILTLELILKCGAISDVARPFELAEKLGGHLCEEFFRYGDLEAAAGMQFTSPRNRRVHLDKAKSRIGFYKSVCLPLFQATARAIPALECNVKQVESNLAIWAGEAEPPDIDGPE